MSSHLVTGVLVVVALIAGCSQTPVQNLSSKNILQSYSQTEMIDEIIRESGWDERLEIIASTGSKKSSDKTDIMVKKEKYEKFEANIAQAFDAVEIRKIFTDSLEANYDAKQFSELLAWLKTPLVQEMMAMELATLMPQAQYEMSLRGDKMMREASPLRLEWIRQMDEARNLTEEQVDMIMMQRAIIQRHRNKAMPPEYHLTEVELEKKLTQQRMKLMLPTRQSIQLGMLYGYRSVADDDLNRYLKASQSEINQWGAALFKNAAIMVVENIGTHKAEVIKKTFIEMNQ
ncbi:MAG: hypothetical protein L3J70_07990 [Gammaproteobacteria bacterium]|nr:hypothetical protein [Gammaproteobacteria bacterium]